MISIDSEIIDIKRTYDRIKQPHEYFLEQQYLTYNEDGSRIINISWVT